MIVRVAFAKGAKTCLRWFLLCFVFAAGSGAALEMAPQSRHFTTSDGVRLHYLEAGNGERVLVFVPGWLMPAAVFDLQLRALSREFRVLALDPRSQGQSEIAAEGHDPARRTQDIAEFLAAAGVRDFVLAGWSLGVLEALDFVERHHPPGLRGLILIDNSIGEGSPPPARKSSFFDQLADPKKRLSYLTEFCRKLVRREPPPKLADAVLASALRVPPDAASQLIRQPYPRTYWREIVSRQEVPVLYAITPRLREQGEALSRRKGRELAQVEVFEDAGHALFVDDADRFNGLAAGFAGRILPAAK